MEDFQKNSTISKKKFMRCPMIYEKQIMDEVVLVHRSTGNYYELNPTGTAIWRYCTISRAREEILDFISQEYQTERSIFENEIDRYLDELIREGLLEIQ